MNKKVKLFIETYIDVIEANNLEFVFRQAAEDLCTHEIYDLSSVLEDIGIQTENIRWKVFDDTVIDYIQWHLNRPNYEKDRSNSWARVDYMLNSISNLGFGYADAKRHVLDNGDIYGTGIHELAPQHGWEGAGDYAFDWFNASEFEKEYFENE